MDIEKVAYRVLGLAIEVHKNLGPGLLESTYESCLVWELTQAGISFQRQKSLPIYYNGLVIQTGYRVDLLIEKNIILELKSIEKLLPIHEAQLLTYLKLSQKRLGFLLNFNVRVMKQGIKRFVL